MRVVVLVFCALAVLFFAPAAGADTLTLSNGGLLQGTLDELTFLAGGKETVYTVDKLSFLWLSGTDRDSLALNDGTKIKGELLAMKFRTAGGVMVFRRAELSAITFTPDPLADLRRELAQKKAKLPPKDAAALFELAEWCTNNSLKTEGIELARISLAIGPKGESSEKAHKLLGDVLYENEWITQAEMIRRKEGDGKKNDGGGEKDDDVLKQPAPPAGDDPKPDEGKLTPEQIKTIKEMIVKNEEIYKKYMERADEKKKEEYAAVRDKYSAEYTALCTRVTDLDKNIRDQDVVRNADIDRYRRDLQARGVPPVEINRLVELQFGTSAAFKTRVDALKAELTKARNDKDRATSSIKSAQSKVANSSANRKSRVRLALEKNKRLLIGGKLLTEEEITQTYEDLFEKN